MEIISESCLKPCNWVEFSGTGDRLKRQDLEFSIPAFTTFTGQKKREESARKLRIRGYAS